jgi:hypothetical protein
MEKFLGRNFLGRNFLGRNFSGRIFVEREHPTENLVKIYLVFSFNEKTFYNLFCKIILQNKLGATGIVNKTQTQLSIFHNKSNSIGGIRYIHVTKQ